MVFLNRVMVRLNNREHHFTSIVMKCHNHTIQDSKRGGLILESLVLTHWFSVCHQIALMEHIDLVENNILFSST